MKEKQEVFTIIKSTLLYNEKNILWQTPFFGFKYKCCSRNVILNIYSHEETDAKLNLTNEKRTEKRFNISCIDTIKKGIRIE